MDKQETFINSNGYLQYRYSQGKGSQLVHRRIAFAEIYCANPNDYSYDFEEYEVHHKNKDILDNRPENLELKLPKDHYYTHFTKDHKRIKDAKLDVFIKPIILPSQNKAEIRLNRSILGFPSVEAKSVLIRSRLSLWQRIKNFVLGCLGMNSVRKFKS